jgi:hypothetical protein
VSEFEDRLSAWLKEQARPGELNPARLPDPRRRRVVSRRDIPLLQIGLAAAFALAIVGLAAPRPPLTGEQPGTSVDALQNSLGPSAGSTPAPSEAPTRPPSRLLAETVVAIIDPSPDGGSRWLLGTLAGTWQALPFAATDSVVRTDWNRVIAAKHGVDALTIEELTPDGVRHELYKGGPATSTVLAAGSPDGKLIAVGVDLGVLLVRDGSPTVLVPPTETDVAVQRGDILWSPTGATVASPLCTELSCVTDVVDLASEMTWKLPDFVPLAISDQVVVGYNSEADRAWRFRSLKDGTELSARSGVIVDAYSAVARSDGRFVLSGEDDAGVLTFTLADPAGAAEVVFRRDPDGTNVLYPAWRSDDQVVLGPRAGLAAAVRDRQPLLAVPALDNDAAPIEIVPPPLP